MQDRTFWTPDAEDCLRRVVDRRDRVEILWQGENGLRGGPAVRVLQFDRGPALYHSFAGPSGATYHLIYREAKDEDRADYSQRCQFVVLLALDDDGLMEVFDAQP